MNHFKEVTYYIIVIIISVVVSFFVERAVGLSEFQSAGSRFTGEDGIWLLKNSNIILTPGANIPGQSTPFREYINNEGLKK